MSLKKRQKSVKVPKIIKPVTNKLKRNHIKMEHLFKIKFSPAPQILQIIMPILIKAMKISITTRATMRII